MLLHRLRKDKKGSVNAEEFENFLRYRNSDYYNLKVKGDGIGKVEEDSIKPFLVEFDPITVGLDGEMAIYRGLLAGLTQTYGHWKGVWWTINTVAPAETYPDISDMIYVDVVSELELQNRLNNAITAPSTAYPIAYFTDTRVYVYGPGVGGTALVTYYKQPDDPYFDYYTDASGNITYLTEGQAAYTLLTGEIARDGSTAGQMVTSLSIDLEWEDYDAVNILDMVVSDVSVALSDPNSFQASMLERKVNAT